MISRLQGVHYNWKGTEKKYAKGFGGDRQIGLIAQDVEAVFPELVYTDSKGYKAVAYDKLVPVLIEAVKEQNAHMKEKDARIENLENQNEKLAKILDELSIRIADLEGAGKKIAME